ncbi:MAG TPA: TonB-dependent receptor [Solimonas sp.]|nr:TonB-dependent receptor [Solimonas sp.]
MHRNARPTAPRLRPTPTAVACAALLCSLSSQAQQADPPKKDDAQPTQSITVTGIRQSLETSVNLKRNAFGLVDGIVAEDIGKFPDTNLAESLSRVSGVSVQRSNGEGTRITVRGMGPDQNLVLLNGRQMPTSFIGDGGTPNSRSFDFSNLASDGIAALEVYKTSRASSPTGGMGATINVRTQRPLDIKETIAQVGVKLVNDQTATRLPSEERGKRATPEVNAIYSTQSADGTFGIALVGTYQERDSGYAQALSPDGWRSFPGIVNNNWGGAGRQEWGGLPAAGGEVLNRPAIDSVYSVPQSIKYQFVGIHRERLNGQATVQVKPSKDLVATLDFVMSEQKFRQRRNDISAWFNFGGQFGEYTSGSPTAPIIYGEHMSGADVASQVARVTTKNKNQQVGLNLKWKASNALNFDFDAHHSTATSGADDPLGTTATIGTASFNRGDTSVDYSKKFPVLMMPTVTMDPALQQLTGSVFSNSYQRNEVNQFQANGKWKIDGDSSLDFGVGYTEVKNRSAFSNVQSNTWGGGVGGPGALDDNLFRLDQISKYFPSIPGSNDPRLFNNIFIYNFEKLRDAAIAVQLNDSLMKAAAGFTNDYRTTEKSKSIYGQYNIAWEAGVPMDLSAGLRYERTSVTSPSIESLPTGVQWVSNNELPISLDANRSVSRSGSYSYALPSIDWSADLTMDTKLRASYGKTIGRPGWAAIQGGRSIDSLGRISGGVGSQGNPDLKPLQSANWDLSLEHYYAKSSYAAVSFFRKSIKDYNSGATSNETIAGVHTPIGGAYYQQALQAGGCLPTDVQCIRDYIFTTFAGQPGVDAVNGIITGLPTDPLMPFAISTYANNKRKSKINGIEFNVQHIFGNTGFGISANYTKVRSNLSYNNNQVGPQMDVLPGMGNSGNLVGFYETADFSARLAYNWRGKFLVANYPGSDSNQAQPEYVQPYGQLDLSVGYNYDKHLRVQFEAINLTDAYVRTYQRTENQIGSVTQLGRRYIIGARYKF